MKKNRKFAILIALCIFITSSLSAVSVSAIEITENSENLHRDIILSVNIEEELYRAQNGISDISVESEDLIQLINETGNSIPVDVLSTTRELYTESAKYSRSENSSTYSESKIYATTVFVDSSVKTQSGSNSSSKLNASIYVTMYWRDNAGTNNELLKITVSWECSDNNTKMYTNYIQYGDSGRSDILYVGEMKNVANGYTWDNIGYVNFGLRAKFYACFVRDNEFSSLEVHVKSSIFA